MDPQNEPKKRSKMFKNLDLKMNPNGLKKWSSTGPKYGLKNGSEYGSENGPLKT